jgi:hypothetical protein
LKDSVTAIGLVAMGTSLPGIENQYSHDHHMFKEQY